MLAVCSGNVARITPYSNFSWDVLALDGDDIIAGNSNCCCFS